jgi:GTP:adenosylcobinamide-phosphate guanylyltransferase
LLDRKREREVKPMYDAVVMAGGGKPEPLTTLEGVNNKAFIQLYGRPILTYILDALVESPTVDNIAVVGPAEELNKLVKADYNITVVEEGGTMLENLANALQAVRQDRLCLVTTGDIPLLNASVVEEFISLSAPYDADLYYPLLSRETCLQSYPDTERTYVQLKDGFLTGGNIGFIRPEWFLKNRDRLELFISYRKKPLKLLRILPLSLIIKYLFKQLAVKDLEIYLSRLLGFKARAVFCTCAEIGLDVDKISDLEQVKKIVERHV